MVKDPQKEEAVNAPGQEVLRSNQEKPFEDKERAESIEQNALQEKADHQAIRETIEAIKLDDNQASQVQTSVSEAAALAEEEKINYLIETAKKKGVPVSVQAAKKMNNPYVLDALHDRLAKEGYYKEFLK